MLVTAGEGGCSYAFHSSKGSEEVYKGFIPILNVEVAETTGAGDAFLAGFLFGLVNVRLSPFSPYPSVDDIVRAQCQASPSALVV